MRINDRLLMQQVDELLVIVDEARQPMRVNATLTTVTLLGGPADRQTHEVDLLMTDTINVAEAQRVSWETAMAEVQGPAFRTWRYRVRQLQHPVDAWVRYVAVPAEQEVVTAWAVFLADSDAADAVLAQLRHEAVTRAVANIQDAGAQLLPREFQRLHWQFTRDRNPEQFDRDQARQQTRHLTVMYGVKGPGLSGTTKARDE